MKKSNRDILIYELNNPRAGNAFGVQQARELIDVLQGISQKNPPHAFIFQARGRLFCAGGNLADYAAMKTPVAGRAANRVISRALKMINELPIPTLCMVQGDCWGGGVEVLSAFDHVIAAPEASFGFWQRRIGLTYGWGGAVRLLKRLSARRLLDLSLQTRAIGAHEALGSGLIDEIVLQSQFKNAASVWVARISENSREPIPFFKKMLAKVSLSEAAEATAFQKLWWKRDHRAALENRLRM